MARIPDAELERLKSEVSLARLIEGQGARTVPAGKLRAAQSFSVSVGEDEGDQPLTFRAQHARLVPIRGFFPWLTRQNHLLYNPASELELPRLEHRLPKHVLTRTERDLGSMS